MENQVSYIQIKRLLRSEHYVNQKLGIALLHGAGVPENDEELWILMGNSTEKLKWCIDYQLHRKVKVAKLNKWINFELLNQFVELQKLYLANYRFSFPVSLNLEDFRQLEILSLSDNFMKKLPKGLPQLTKLHTLYLQNNQFLKLDMAISRLPALRVLHLAKNKIKQLPTQLAQLRQLERLYLTHNNLKRLPENIGSFVNLQFLHLSNNKLDVLPDTIGKLQNLKQLHLSGNKISAIPESLLNLVQLEQLILSQNPIARDHNIIERLRKALPDTKIVV